MVGGGGGPCPIALLMQRVGMRAVEGRPSRRLKRKGEGMCSGVIAQRPQQDQHESSSGSPDLIQRHQAL